VDRAAQFPEERFLRAVNILRRLPLTRLLALCAVIVAFGAGAAALASALTAGPVPQAKPLAQAVHDALGGPAVQGVSAKITFTNHLLEGASLAGAAGGGSGGGLSSSPLLNGGSGRLWASSDGRVRIELQSEKGDTEIIWDGHTLTVLDAAEETAYRWTPKQSETGAPSTPGEDHGHEAPSVAKVEEAIAHLRKHVNVAEASPTDVGGQPAYTVRISPKEAGSLIGAAEVSFDAVHGLPLRAAIYSSTDPSPVIELAASEVSYGPVASSVFEIQPPAGAKVQELKLHEHSSAQQPGHTGTGQGNTHLTAHGNGITTIGVLETPEKSGSKTSGQLEGLPKVNINGAQASELRTELGTILTFARSGVRYVVAGALAPGPVEALARGL
jgi:outer membrane lipoprotein-sorting protein